MGGTSVRKLLGGVVLVAGVLGLGWYGSANNARVMEAEVTAGAAKAAQGTIHAITTTVSGRDILVSGIANDEAERDAILATMHDVNGRRVVRDALEVLDKAQPFTLTAVKTDELITYSGEIPTEADRAVLAERIGDAAGDLALKSGVPSSDWMGAVSQGLDGLDALKSGTLSIIDQDLVLKGNALTPDAEIAARAAFADLAEGYSTTYDITLLDDGTPFSLNMVKDADSVVATGKFPENLAVTDIVGDIDAAGIQRSILNDDTGSFAAVARKGVQAFDVLENGVLDIVGSDVSLTGTAFTPTERSAAELALSDLPDGYNTITDIETRDDGTPPNFGVLYVAAEGASVAGKLPADLDVAQIASALDVPQANGEVIQGLIGSGEQAVEKLTVLSGWLPELETMRFNSNDGVITVDAEVAPGVDQDLVYAGLADGLGEEATVTVTSLADLPVEGETRLNVATGLTETFTAGYWLPVFDFASDAETCGTQSNGALKKDRINFVTGSAQLDAQSVRAINAVASIIRKCVSETDLHVEIGGHTDSQGGEDLNLSLSQSRAEAVRLALVTRGVPDGDISAKGYGETQPIADNDTEQGRAANRRTAITWLEPVVETSVPDVEPEAAEPETNTQVGE